MILVVDDELSMRQFLQILLEKEGRAVMTAENGTRALELLRQHPCELVISDIRMPGISGLELLATLKEERPNLPVILITAFASPEDAVTAMKHDAFDYITKPFNVQEIMRVVRAAASRQGKTAPAPGNTFPEIIGDSPEMRKIFDLIRRVAPTPANVLITGESGTGKELVAQAIHRHSRASEKNFIPINCSAIPENLLESELFGHVKGAFTGAIANKEGLFQMADGGTAFLDEIGEISPIIQTKLLRVLQERECKPVGGTKSQRVNVRIIAATNRDLEAEVASSQFRQDLYYRLAVVPIRVPPLRERKGDVPVLVNHFLRKYSARFQKDIREISKYALEVLMAYDFPGNVRELENIVERGVALESSHIILPESLTLSSPGNSQKAAAKHEDVLAMVSRQDIADRGLETVIEDIEKRLFLYAMEHSGHSKMRAAELLGMSFRAFRYKAKKYGIQ